MSDSERTLVLRRNELARRVAAIPDEVAAWKRRARREQQANAHYSQVQAISVLMEEFSSRQQNALAELDDTTDSTRFATKCDVLIQEIIRAQRVWDYFRDKLDLRFSPTFQKPLWVADTVAWDCYRPVLENAADHQILSHDELREPPLVYLTAEFSASTWARGRRPHEAGSFGLGSASLPIPVVEMPWDHMQNTWEFLSIPHEVGHDLDADLKLRDPLGVHLQAALTQAGIPNERMDIWMQWQGEVFADLVALQLAGPAYADYLLHLLLLPLHMVTQYNGNDPHPTPYLRILMNAAYVRELIPGHAELTGHADELENLWRELYGNQPKFDGLVGDFSHVFSALMKTPVAVLKDKTVRELIPFSANDDARTRDAVDYLIRGLNSPDDLRPRHCVSAARLAATAATKEADVAQTLDKINTRTTKLISTNAVPGLRADNDSSPHKAFIKSFVDAIPL